MPTTAHVAAASLNQTVGDWSGNERRIRAAIAEARSRGARLLLLPENCIPGYSLGDRLTRRGTIERSWDMLTALTDATAGMVVIVGLPIRHGDVLYNASAVLADGAIVGLVAKENLATGDVEYENRWYGGWPPGRFDTFRAPDGAEVPIGRLLFDAPGLGRIGIEICEDGWKGIRPGSMYALCGATILCNPSASWFVLGKHAVRRRMVQQISREDHVAYLYASLLGCDATRLIFDGSVFITQNGEVLEEGRRFLFADELEMVDRIIDTDALVQARVEEGSWRQQVDAIQRGELGVRPRVIQLEGDFGSSQAAPPPPPYWVPPAPPSADPSLDWLHQTGLIRQAPSALDLPHLELELALALGLHEYTRKCGIRSIALALSGGRDSAMCAVLVQRMLRYAEPELDVEALRARAHERFVTAYMGTDNSSSNTRNAARALAEEIGALHLEGAIQETVDLHVQTIAAMTGTDVTWDNPAHDIPLQNVQARLRGSLIWFIANLHNALLLSTSNKSEAAVGYTTMDGDTSGGLSPIADVPKSLVSSWLRWAGSFHAIDAIRDVFGVPATAELRPASEAQTDEDDLMPFAVLDRLMYHFVQLGQDPLEMFEALWPTFEERYSGDPRGFRDHIRKFVRKLCFAQWKRERFAISFRVTAFDLDPKTGFRFPPVQAPFSRELDELDELVERMIDG